MRSAKLRTYNAIAAETAAGDESIDVPIVIIIAVTDHHAQFVSTDCDAEWSTRGLGFFAHGPSLRVDVVESMRFTACDPQRCSVEGQSERLRSGRRAS